MDELSDPIEVESIDHREKLLEEQGKDVTIDYFFYSCLEYAKTSPCVGIPLGAVGRWPPLTNPNGALDSSSIEEAFTKVTAWYTENYPDLKSANPLDHLHLAKIIYPFVQWSKDIEELHERICGKPIPIADDNGLWTLLRELTSTMFPNHQDLTYAYLKWTHAGEPKAVEPGSRPPVGRFAKIPRRNSAPQRSDRNGSRDRNGGRDRNGNRSRRSDSGGHRQKDRDRNRHDKTRPKKSSELEAQALKEIARAIRKLKDDPNLEEVQLPPANSFYRRLQHQSAKDQGFTSASVGEGPDRSVLLIRVQK